MEPTNIWMVAVFIAWLGGIGGFYFYSIHKGWMESGIFQSLSNLQSYRLAKRVWILTLLLVALSVAAFIYFETDLIFKGFPPAHVKLTVDEYESKLEGRHQIIIQGSNLFKDGIPEVMLSEKEHIEERTAEVSSDYSKYVAWIRSQIRYLETLKNSVSTDLLIKARQALAADSNVEADLYLEEIERTQRAHPETASKIAYMRGRLAKWEVDYEKAYEHVVRAAYLMANNAGLYKEAGHMAYNVGEYRKSLDYYEAALALDVRVHGEDYSEIARDHINLGAVWWRLGDYRKALEHYERALAIDLKTYGENHASLANDHNNMGVALVRLEEYGKAIPHFEQALAIDLAAYGQHHSQAVRRYEKLGWAWGELKDYRKAIHYYEKALDGSLKIYGKNHVEVAELQNDLGWCWVNLGEYSMSRIYYKYALDGYLKNYGENHSLVIQTRDNLERLNRALIKTKNSESRSRKSE